MTAAGYVEAGRVACGSVAAASLAGLARLWPGCGQAVGRCREAGWLTMAAGSHPPGLRRRTLRPARPLVRDGGGNHHPPGPAGPGWLGRGWLGLPARGMLWPEADSRAGRGTVLLQAGDQGITASGIHAASTDIHTGSQVYSKERQRITLPSAGGAHV